MGRELGRISGPLLAENLLRNGVDLAFETDLLYFDVVNGRIGINNDAPPRTLFVNNTVRTTNLVVDSGITVPNFSIHTDTIQQLTGSLYIQPDQTSDPQITAVALGTSLLTFDNNEISNATADSDINFTPTSGVTNINNSINVNGSLHATGNITWDGDITLGNNADDNINFVSDVKSDIVPNYPLDYLTTESGNILITESGLRIVAEVLESFDLGSAIKKWNHLYSNIVQTRFTYANLSSIGTAYIGNFRLTSNQITNLAGAPMYLTPSTDVGVVNFNSTNFVYENNFINQTNTALTFNSTDNGYTKFAGTYGIVLPQGPTIGAEGVETGQLRYNTELGYVRVFNGTEWISCIGNSTSIPEEDTYNIMDVWSLVLG